MQHLNNKFPFPWKKIKNYQKIAKTRIIKKLITSINCKKYATAYHPTSEVVPGPYCRKKSKIFET